MEAVVDIIGKINQPDAGSFGEFFKKGLAQVLVVQGEFYIIQQTLNIIAFNARVEPDD